ncbi:hypothetical protein [Vandammella animalimorsus]|uniref:hypothetical protein n=1 Tax=Vandammella animalimorsus TaxID=2029117 RepID=UPI0011C3C6CC|nr:hypothetical protein [Vandammella animalimorsus]
MNIEKICRKGMYWTVVAGAATVLLACGGGGGGGSGGTPNAPYKIELTAQRYSLPLNLENKRPGLGGYSGVGRLSPYTVALDVKATIAGRPIPSSGDEKVFGCSLDRSIGNDVSLYYLDGDPEHMVDVTLADGRTVKIPGAYRSIALPSNAGMATFHFHADDTAGVAKITCTIQDPRDKQVREASVEIKVGEDNPNPSPTDLYIETRTTGSVGYTFTQGSQLNNQIQVQSAIFDVQNQRVPDPVGNNLHARIVSGYSDAAIGARLGSAGSGSTGRNTWVSSKTINGRATFTVFGGQYEGPILIEFLTDALDNNVDNGIAVPVSNLTVVYALNQPPPDFVTPVEIADQELVGYFEQPFLAVLDFAVDDKGNKLRGIPPHTWRLVSGRLPEGLNLQSNGVIAGTPKEIIKDHKFEVAVVDSTASRLPWAGNQSDTHVFSITINESQYKVHIAECGSAGTSGSVCELPPAVVGTTYVSVLTGAGGNGTYTWESIPASPPPIHGFLNFDPQTAILTSEGEVPVSLLACVKVPGNPGNPGGTPPVPPTPDTFEYQDKSYDFVISVTSAGITHRQPVRVKVTGDGTKPTSCP